jgi:hypothetical protein
MPKFPNNVNVGLIFSSDLSWSVHIYIVNNADLLGKDQILTDRIHVITGRPIFFHESLYLKTGCEPL